MSYGLSPEDVAQAASRLTAAENDLTATISGTKTTALGRLNEGLAGPIHSACTDLINTWSKEVEVVANILTEFKQSLTSTSETASETAAAQAASISNIDVHATRLG